jgi:L-lactate dehydrogenase (cytochrome)
MKGLASAKPLEMLPHLLQFLARPRWLAAYLGDGGLMKFPNIILPSGPMPYADVTAALEASMVSWSDLKWIRDAWQGKVVVKGVHTADDARRAIDAGADAVVVSNHGGRQLDGVAATIHVLPEIVAAVNKHDGRVEVLLDGGIRRGGDVVKALCMGARAVLIGRAYAYGLAAGGGPGVTRAIEILRTDIVRTLQLLGIGSTTALDGSLVDVPEQWMRSGVRG